MGAGVNSTFNAGSVIGRLGLGFIADTRLGKINTYAIAVLTSGLLQFVSWLAAVSDGNRAATFLFAVLFGLAGGGELGLYPTVLADLFPEADLCLSFQCPLILADLLTAEPAPSVSFWYQNYLGP